MRMWMIAERALWEDLQRKRSLYVDPGRVDEFYVEAYDWMRRQMAVRLPDYHGHYPWWAWVQWERRRPRPDLRARENHYFEPGTPSVRLELEVSPSRVLQSDFELWHFPLNRSYLGWSRAECRAWDKLPEVDRTRELLERSWEHIFLLDYPDADPKWLGGKRATIIQAVFEELRACDVVRITHYVSRPVGWSDESA